MPLAPGGWRGQHLGRAPHAHLAYFRRLCHRGPAGHAATGDPGGGRAAGRAGAGPGSVRFGTARSGWCAPSCRWRCQCPASRRPRSRWSTSVTVDWTPLAAPAPAPCSRRARRRRAARPSRPCARPTTASPRSRPWPSGCCRWLWAQAARPWRWPSWGCGERERPGAVARARGPGGRARRPRRRGAARAGGATGAAAGATRRNPGRRTRCEAGIGAQSGLRVAARRAGAHCDARSPTAGRARRRTRQISPSPIRRSTCPGVHQCPRPGGPRAWPDPGAAGFRGGRSH